MPYRIGKKYHHFANGDYTPTFYNSALLWLPSHETIWSDVIPVKVTSERRDDWWSASVVSQNLVLQLSNHQALNLWSTLH